MATKTEWKPKAGDTVWIMDWKTHEPKTVVIDRVSTAISGDTLYEVPFSMKGLGAYKLNQVGRNKREATEKALARAAELRDKWQAHIDAIRGTK